MKGKRSAALCYGLTLLSSGLFLPYWIYLLMSDVNELRRHGVFNATRWVQALYGIWAFNLLLIIASDLTGNFALGRLIMIIGIALLFLMVVAIIRVDREVRRLQGRANTWFSALGAVLLTLLFYVSMAVSQARVNRVRSARA
jgi:hypothetical protein